MRKFTRPIDLMHHKMKQLNGMKINYQKEVEKIAEEYLQDAIAFTGGGISKKTLAKMGHPYGRGPNPAKRHAAGLKRGKAPMLPINMQSGRLRRGWYLKRRSQSGRAVFVIGNSARHARYILSPWGTKKMVGRRLWGHPSYAKGAPMGELARRGRARLKGLVQAVRARNRASII